MEGVIEATGCEPGPDAGGSGPGSPCFPLRAAAITAARLREDYTMRRRTLSLMCLAGVVFSTIALAVPDALATVTSGDEALLLVIDELLGNNTEGKRIFVSRECFPSGTPIHSWKGEVFTTGASGWVVFIDDLPAANWLHPARYVFVEREAGQLEVYPATVPFKDEDGYREYPTRMQRLILGAQERRLSFDHVPKVPPRETGTDYAVLMSGGGSIMTNYVRYWNDLSNIYTGLTTVYGYDDRNIYVLCSDGLDPAPDRANGTSSPPDLDGDGDDDIDFACTKDKIELVFQQLGYLLTPEDQLFVFTTDHGGGMSWDVHLNLWGFQELHDWELRDMVDALPQCNMIFTMEQCTSGGFMDDLCWDHDGRVFSSACEFDQPSFAMSPWYEYDAYVFHWTAAVRWVDAYGDRVDADYNRDGLVDMKEAFIYAETHDMEPEHPQYDDRPQALGSELTLYGPAPLGTVEGNVTDATTSLGIEGQVEVLATGRRADCDTSGYYFVVVLAETTYLLEAGCFGYYPVQDSIFVPEETTVQLDFALHPMPTGTLEGTVIDAETFLPIEGAEITILETPLDPIYTDPGGFYALDLPGDASYDVRAAAYGHVSQVAPDVYVPQSGTTTLDFALHPAPGILIWEADHSPISGDAQLEALGRNGLASIVSTDLFSCGDLSYFDAVFVNLGICPTNYFIVENSPEAMALLTYIYEGGNLYLEGGDVWAFDPYLGGHDFAPYFGIHPTNDGTQDLYSVSGEANTLMPDLEGMWFDYIGGHDYIDHIMPIPPAELVFRNAENDDPIGVAKTNTYGGRTLGTSFEFGGLVDGENTKTELMAAIVEFFDLAPSLPDVSVVLEPDAMVYARGETLGFTATVTNNTLEVQSFYAIGEVMLPNGNPYTGNPVVGPRSITLQPGGSATAHVTHFIPYSAPLGTYIYTGTIGLPPDIVIDSDSFQFIVTP